MIRDRDDDGLIIDDDQDDVQTDVDLLQDVDINGDVNLQRMLDIFVQQFIQDEDFVHQP